MTKDTIIKPKTQIRIGVLAAKVLFVLLMLLWIYLFTHYITLALREGIFVIDWCQTVTATYLPLTILVGSCIVSVNRRLLVLTHFLLGGIIICFSIILFLFYSYLWLFFMIISIGCLSQAVFGIYREKQ